MSAPASDVRLHLDYWIDALNTALDPRDAYRRGEVPGYDKNPGEKPKIYALVDIRRRAYTPMTMTAHPDVSGWVVTVWGVGRTVNESAWVLDKATEALEFASVTIGGHESTPLAVEPGAAIGSKDGIASGSISFTYTL